MRYLLLASIAATGCSLRGLGGEAPDLLLFPAHCFDAAKDGDETDVDCGGSCPPCAVAQACLTRADCAISCCINNRCIEGSSDSDNDGDPDTSDCAACDPKIHHPNYDQTSPYYDPFPQSANCCPYTLKYKDPVTMMDVFVNPSKYCHPDTCGTGLLLDCTLPIECFRDQDCDGYSASAVQPMGCSAPPNTPPGNDCNDCDPAIHPDAGC